MSESSIDIDACRRRQQRLLAVMDDLNLDWAILSSIENVQWLTGVRFQWFFSPVVALRRDGHVTLVAPNKVPPESAADEVVTFEAKWHSTLRNDQRHASTQRLVECLPASAWAESVGLQYSVGGIHLFQSCKASTVDLDPHLYELRRTKDSDELRRLKIAIGGTERMYAKAKELIEPGITEIDLFNALQTAAVESFDEMLTGTGNDYQCGSRGGPPRGGRKAEAGELYILDLGPAYQGYFADNARTFAVSDVSSTQQAAWEKIMEAFQHIEANVRPGKSCKELFQEVQLILDQCEVGVFNHHLGHGIGLFPHETPHLNPNWDDTFKEGDVFTAEPGLYADELRHGMRIENDYLVTSTGVECLTRFPMELI